MLKMAGYWQSYFFAFVWTDTKTKELSQYLATLTECKLKNKRKLSLCSNCLDDLPESIKEVNKPKNT